MIIGQDFLQPVVYMSLTAKQGTHNKQGEFQNIPNLLIKYSKNINYLEDIAAYTGAKVITESKRFDKDLNLKHYQGFATKIVASPTSTMIVGGNGDTTDRMLDLQSLVKTQEDNAEYKDRLARLTGSIGIIRVGAPTDVELKERKDRFDDAVCAVRSALEEGILPGGGSFLFHCAGMLKSVKNGVENRDQQRGVQIVIDSICESVAQITLNAGLRPDKIMKELRKFPDTFGYNAREYKYVDMIDAGVIDPAKVIRVALQNAASVAGTFLTTEATVLCDRFQQ